MSKEEILQENKLIAEFMGCYGEIMWSGGFEVFRYGFRNITHITDRWHESQFDVNTPYHESWDWLMPVVEKIEAISVGNFKGVYKLRIDPWNVAITDYTNLSEDDTEDIVEIQRDDSTLLDDVYFCVVAFIKWKNKNL